MEEEERETERKREHFGRFIIGLLLSCFHQTLCNLRCHHGTALGRERERERERERLQAAP